MRWPETNGEAVCPRCSHGVSPQYLYQYANHAAWLEDNRRTDNGTLARIVVSNAMGSPVSRAWKGYWQRAAA